MKGQLSTRDIQYIERRIQGLQRQISNVKRQGKSKKKELAVLFNIKARLKGWLNQR